ncbi:MAG: type II toxin-antitoxin system VapC family toxin [Magnetococcales bacterium]|nr:type II toxin-antitoxin system VapC family toxin [Magnetococcales bacterium]
MGFLIDTNILSELRKGSRADINVRHWLDQTSEADIFLSVLVLGEIRNGIERLRRRDSTKTVLLENWLHEVMMTMSDRILPITPQIADYWGRLGVPDPLPVIDSLLAATALAHDLVLVTRNVVDMARSGVKIINPFEYSKV